MTTTVVRRAITVCVVKRTVIVSLMIWLCFGLLTAGSHAEELEKIEESGVRDRPRFMPVDIFIDPHGEPLAAYQLELIDSHESIRIVGVEGGESPAFAKPPYYDPKAIAQHRIVVAAFSTAGALPTSKSRVTTLHVVQEGKRNPDLHVKLTAAATPARKRIDATATFRLGAVR
jgi:hypothetical protein